MIKRVPATWNNICVIDIEFVWNSFCVMWACGSKYWWFLEIKVGMGWTIVMEKKLHGKNRYETKIEMKKELKLERVEIRERLKREKRRNKRILKWEKRRTWKKWQKRDMISNGMKKKQSLSASTVKKTIKNAYFNSKV